MCAKRQTALAYIARKTRKTELAENGRKQRLLWKLFLAILECRIGVEHSSVC